MRRQAKLADMRRQAILLARRMLDSMRPAANWPSRRKRRGKMTPATHGKVRLASSMTGNGRLIDLNEQALEIFTFRKIQSHRMIGRAGQATDNARLAPGIQRRPATIFWNSSSPMPPEQE